MDVIAFHPSTGDLIHVEVSGDADPWEKRITLLKKKFEIANTYYKEIFKFPISEIKQIAIAGWGKPVTLQNDFPDSKKLIFRSLLIKVSFSL
jgi:hypothetical protein